MIEVFGATETNFYFDSHEWADARRVWRDIRRGTLFDASRPVRRIQGLATTGDVNANGAILDPGGAILPPVVPLLVAHVGGGRSARHVRTTLMDGSCSR